MTAALDASIGFEDFARDERAALVRVAWAMCGDLATAEDLVHEVLAEMFSRWSMIDQPRAYARRAVTNRLISRWRRGERERAALRRLSAQPVREVLLPETSDEVWKAVRRLPNRQRAALVLAVVDDMAVAGIAGILGCSIESARTHLRRAKDRLAVDLAHLKEHR